MLNTNNDANTWFLDTFRTADAEKDNNDRWRRRTKRYLFIVGVVVRVGLVVGQLVAERHRLGRRHVGLVRRLSRRLRRRLLDVLPQARVAAGRRLHGQLGGQHDWYVPVIMRPCRRRVRATYVWNKGAIVVTLRCRMGTSGSYYNRKVVKAVNVSLYRVYFVNHGHNLR